MDNLKRNAKENTSMDHSVDSAAESSVDRKLQEIKTADIRQWQNTIMNHRDANGKGYSQVYLKTIHNQMSAILNHAVNFYDLKSNVARKAGSMGKEKSKEINYLYRAAISRTSRAMLSRSHIGERTSSWFPCLSSSKTKSVAGRRRYSKMAHSPAGSFSVSFWL